MLFKARKGLKTTYYFGVLDYPFLTELPLFVYYEDYKRYKQ